MIVKCFVAGQDEPEWVEVVTEMLLSLLSQPSNAVRSVVTTVFAMLCPHITAGALQLILDVSNWQIETYKRVMCLKGPVNFALIFPNS